MLSPFLYSVFNKVEIKNPPCWWTLMSFSEVGEEEKVEEEEIKKEEEVKEAIGKRRKKRENIFSRGGFETLFFHLVCSAEFSLRILSSSRRSTPPPPSLTCGRQQLTNLPKPLNLCKTLLHFLHMPVVLSRADGQISLGISACSSEERKVLCG